MKKLVTASLQKMDVYLFITANVIIYVYADLFQNLFEPPNGIHFIRKTDSLSFVQTYFYNSFDFFNPQNFNLSSNEGKGISEFPFLYFISSISYLIFGQKLFLLKWWILLFNFLGNIFAYKILRRSNSALEALFGTILFLSSTVYIYYAGNYIIDSAALGMSLIAWYYGMSFQESKNLKHHFYLAIFFFSLSSLTKAYFIIQPLAWLVWFLKNQQPEKSFKILLGSIPLIVTLVWVGYVRWYNMNAHNDYFLTEFRPIWLMSLEQINITWSYISSYWWNRFYYPSTFHFYLIVSIAIIIIGRIKKLALPLLPLLHLVFSLIFIVLFYAQFRDHDYYFLAIMPIFLFLINDFLSHFKTLDGALLKKLPLISLVILSPLSANYACYKAKQRFDEKKDDFSMIWFDLKKLDRMNLLSSLSFNGTDTILVLNDPTRNGGLLYLKSFGWSKAESNVTQDELDLYKSRGLSYIIDPKSSLTNETIKRFELEKINDYVYVTD